MLRRIVAAAVAIAAAGLLALASTLAPDPAGHGTHEQLGLYKCGWPMAFGIPCPTCGMTTAFAHAADGNLPAAFRAQPFGALTALACAASVWVGGYIALTGSHIGAVCATMLRPRWVWAMCFLLALAWVYKIITFPPTDSWSLL